MRTWCLFVSFPGTKLVSPHFCDPLTPGNSMLVFHQLRGGFVSLLSHAQRKGKHREVHEDHSRRVLWRAQPTAPPTDVPRAGGGGETSEAAAGPAPGDEHRLASVARRCSTAARCAVKGCSRVRSSTSGRCGTSAGSHSSTRSVSTVIAWSNASFTSSHPPSISSMTTMAMMFSLLRRRWSRPRENAGARNGANRRQ